jgi:hypothetical protein
MTCNVKDGGRTWSMTRDTDGNRKYKFVTLVISDDPKDGPATVLQTAGIPIPGDYWIIDNDADLWATCKLDAEVKPLVTNEPNYQWEVTQTFDTKADDKKCKDQQLEDPLLIPDRISGGFTRYQEEATEDRDGNPIENSAHEQFRGPQVEFDKNRPSVKIAQNVPDLELGLFSSMIDNVNTDPLWGLGPRCIKLSNVTWERKFYGQCYRYFERTLEFEIRYDGFDRDLLDEGTKVLNGHWKDPRTSDQWVVDNIAGAAPDPSNPKHFIRFVDRRGNPSKVILDGHGLPSGVPIGTGATAVASILADVVNNVVITNGGSGYSSAPKVIFKGGGGFGAAGTALISGGSVIGVNITAGGQDYTEVPSVEFSSMGEPGKIHVEKYDEADFLVLNIPTDLEA